MARVIVTGDIHGQFKALKQVLKRCNFDYQNDKMIVLGDVVDGGEQTKQCVDELLKIKNLIYILGNHDIWFMDWVKRGIELPIWYHQGGKNTILSYDNNYKNVPEKHYWMFQTAHAFYIQDEMLFVHGGFNPERPIEEQPIDDLVWDRSLISYAKQHKIEGYKHVFIGHTTTQFMGQYIEIEDITKPVTLNNLTMMDTGAGWRGKLSAMDIQTREIWQSDFVEEGR